MYFVMAPGRRHNNHNFDSKTSTPPSPHVIKNVNTMSLDPNSNASEWKHRLVEAEAHADALMSAPLTHSIECPGPDPGMGLELQKVERTKSQAKDASEKKKPPSPGMRSWRRTG
jgi:hypothetical protein